jgi:hypothetical protein
VEVEVWSLVPIVEPLRVETLRSVCALGGH